jgi:hypothetical protein
VMIGSNGDTVSGFVSVHDKENESRKMNSTLQVPVPGDADSQHGANKLKSAFVDRRDSVATARARVLLGWHGTSTENVLKVCRDGPRSRHTTDAGFFGSGSYFALEPSYAEQYCGPCTSSSGERAVILFAISVSQAKIVTLDLDYQGRESPLYGFSKFYSGRRDVAIAMDAQHDAHFIPVKRYGFTHPFTGKTTSTNFHYQAAQAGEATAHEIVVRSHHRCIPLAVVMFRNAQHVDPTAIIRNDQGN